MDEATLTASLNWAAIAISAVAILISVKVIIECRRGHRELDALEEQERQRSDEALTDWREERQGWLELLAKERGVDVSELRITRTGDGPVEVRTRSEMAAWRRSLAEEET